MPCVGERFTRRGGTFDTDGEPKDGGNAAFTDDGKTITRDDERFGTVSTGFTNVGKKNETIGESFTALGAIFDDGGTKSFRRRGASAVDRARFVLRVR